MAKQFKTRSEKSRRITISHWKEWEDCMWDYKTRFYNIYNNLRKRCNNQKYQYFSSYWWKWIKNERKSYKEFKEDMYESYIDHVEKYWEKQTSIDRIDNNWNYCKENCKWSTWKEQNNNQSRSVKYDWHWQKLWLSQIYDLSNPVVSRTVYYTRVRKYKWDINKALNTPIKWEKIL